MSAKRPSVIPTVPSSLLLVALLAMAGCEYTDRIRLTDRDGDSERLLLSLQPPEDLDWGREGVIEIVVQNRADAAADNVRAELRLPAWLEFGPVRPVGTEMTVIGREDGTIVTYRLEPPLRAGESRSLQQRVRVPQAGPAQRPASDPAREAGAMEVRDTAPIQAPPPSDRTLRARLVTAGGEGLGAEVAMSVPFRGAPAAPLDGTSAIAGADDSRTLTSSGVGSLRVGMARDEARRLAPGARDTTWLEDGTEVRGMLLPTDGDTPHVAILDEGGIRRIIVRDSAAATREGIRVGSRLSELRARDGAMCAATDQASGRTIVWHRDEGQIAYVLSGTGGATPAAPSPAAGGAGAAGEGDAEAGQPAPGRTGQERARVDPAGLPDTARVSEIWIRRDPGSC